MSSPRVVLRSLLRPGGKQRALHLSWIAFFASFVVWFNFAPFSAAIGRQLHLDKAQLATLALSNLGLTVPARMLIGAALDRWGPRRVFGSVLIFAAVPNTVFALAASFPVLVVSRLALSVVGAGFVVGIRMVAEWWPRSELGAAEGIYGGWGNFGAGAATVGLPVLAGWLGGTDGWRWAIGSTGALAAAWGVVYLVFARDTPADRGWVAPRRQGALEVTSRGAVAGLIVLTLPVVAILGLIAYRIESAHVISGTTFRIVLAVLALTEVAQVGQILRVNRPALASLYPVEDRYPFRAVVACCLAYAVTFGGELTVLSILPAFFGATWHLGLASAGVAAGTFGLMNLVTRPSGGMLSDAVGRRRTVLVSMLAGSAGVFVVMSLLHRAWPVALAVLVGIGAAAFLQGGNGAVFAIVPQISRPVGGQIAGLTGAYGNIGAIVLLFTFVYVSPQAIFLIIAGSAALVGLVSLRLLPEPLTGSRLPAHEPAAGLALAAQPTGQR